MKIHFSVLSVLAFGLAGSAQAVECMTADSVPVLMIASTTDALSLAGDSLPATLDDSKLVCVRYDSDNRVADIEYVNRKDPSKNEAVSLKQVIEKGYEATQYVDLLGRDITVARTTCPGCNPAATEITLVMGLLNRYKLIGQNGWIYPKVTVNFASRSEPRATLNGIPFQLLTLKTKGGLGGGVKQIRQSECVEADLVQCLKANQPKFRHVKIHQY